MNDYTQDNTISRQQVIDLAKRLKDDQLTYPLPAGWTVSGVFAHLAFWDQRALILIQKWRRDGISDSAVDVDIINEATRGLCINVTPQQATNFFISSAEALDAEIEQLSPEFLSQIESDGLTVRLNRALHRQDHIVQIVKELNL